MNLAKKTQIVVIGGGAGGLELVASLGRKYGRTGKFDIILVERNRSHIWKPLLHEVAAGALDANMDEVGYRYHAHRCGYRFFYGEFRSIDRDANEVIIAPTLDEDGSEVMGEHRIRYDYLVLSVGSVSNDFGTPGVAEHCIFLDSRQQADRFRLKLLNRCLKVSREIMANDRAESFVDIAIVGGGATGVELSAELFNAASALKLYGLEVFDEKRLRVTLIEAGPRILPALQDDIADAAREELEKLGVIVRTATKINKASAEGMHTDDDSIIRADLRVWAAGVKGANYLADLAGLETNRANQFVVSPTLQTTRDPKIFAIGDCCACLMPDGGRNVPPRAQSAHQMASHVFKNLGRLINQQTLIEYHYKDHGSLVSLSRYSTVGSLMGALVGGRMAVEGRIARMVYMSLYRMHLLAIHGWFRGLIMMGVGKMNNVIRPRLKLH